MGDVNVGSGTIAGIFLDLARIKIDIQGIESTIAHPGLPY